MYLYGNCFIRVNNLKVSGRLREKIKDLEYMRLLVLGTVCSLAT